MTRPSRLSAGFVRTVTTPGRYGDGRGGHSLSLLVKPSTRKGLSKTWSQRLRTANGVAQIGLGVYPDVSLEAARDRAVDQARAVRAGTLLPGHPSAKVARRERRSIAPTFAEAAERTIETYRSSWKDGAKTARLWHSRLDTYALPTLGDIPVAAVSSADIFDVILPLWSTKRETSRKVLQAIRGVMAWSIAKGYRGDNPAAADVITPALPRAGARVQHRPAVPYAEVPAALARVDASDAYEVTKLALRFLTLTATRSGEVRGAHWAEINGNTWTIPASRMKAGRAHRVPLSAAALDVLNRVREYSTTSGHIFPSPTGKALSDSTLSKLLRELGVAGTPHGMRSSFRVWAAESGIDRVIAEMCLAHEVGTATELAYDRSDYFEARRAVMEQWAQVCQA